MKLAYPPIYTFELPGAPGEWGWMRWCDIVQTVNDLFPGVNRSAGEIAKDYVPLSTEGETISVVEEVNSEEGHRYCEVCFAEIAFEYEGLFVPAGWGKDIITVAKAGFIEIFPVDFEGKRGLIGKKSGDEILKSIIHLFDK